MTGRSKFRLACNWTSGRLILSGFALTCRMERLFSPKLHRSASGLQTNLLATRVMLRRIQVAFLISSLSLALAQSPTSRPSGSAEEVLNEARKTYSEQGPRAGLPKFEQALALFHEKGDRRGEAISLGQIGNCYER